MKTNNSSESRRLTRLEDREAIKTLKARYAEALDNRFNGDEVSALFAEGATWQVGKDEAPTRGREAIKQHCANLAKNISWSIHYFFPSVIQLDEDGIHATGSFYILDLQTLKNEAGEDEAYLFAGKFKDRFIKIEGNWYFENVYGIIDVVTPWSESWVSKAFVPNFFASR